MMNGQLKITDFTMMCIMDLIKVEICIKIFSRLQWMVILVYTGVDLNI